MKPTKYLNFFSFEEIFEMFNEFYDESIRAKFEEVEELKDKKLMITGVQYLVISFEDKEGNHYNLLPNFEKKDFETEQLVLKKGCLYDSEEDNNTIKTFDSLLAKSS